MNQILVTGEEKVTANVTNKVKKQQKVLPTKSIVVFFAICIIILGICMISGSVYSKTKINETIEANVRPEISVERNDENDTVEIRVTHIRGIKSVVYRWNEEEETLIDGRNRKSINETLDLIGGENTLKIEVTEEDGRVKTFEKTFVVGNIPEIKLEAVSNGVKIIVTSETEIDYIQYCWDEGEMQKVEVKEMEYEGVINAPKGQHNLKIEVLDINGIKAEKNQLVVGDTEPIVNIKSKMIEGKAKFVIDVEDDENIKNIIIVHNGGEQQIIDVNEKTYHYEVTMTEGEENTIIVTATNKNDLTKTKGVKFRNM